MIYQRFGKWWGAFSLFDFQAVNFLTWVTEFAAIALAVSHMAFRRILGVPFAAVGRRCMMHFMPVTIDVNPNDLAEKHYLVLHPPDDVPEEKWILATSGPMPMTLSGKPSLIALRSDLILIIALVFYHVLAGFFGHHG